MMWEILVVSYITSIYYKKSGMTHELIQSAETFRVVKTACPHDCPDTCSMLATVKQEADGSLRLISVQGNPANSYTRGNLCRKVAHYEERVYAKERALTPLRRIGRKGEGSFERISWEDAIDEISSRWKSIIQKNGPEAILPYSYAGTMGVVNMSACDGRLWFRMGASRLLRTICSSAATAGYSYVNGWSGGMDPEDFVNSRFIIAWGTNLSSTNVHLMPIIREAQQKGAIFVVIDPFRTRTANAADRFLQPYPGTDAALALSMAHILFRDNLHDEDYLDKNSIGWKDFRKRCSEYPPARAAALTGLMEEEIEWLAHAYYEQQPSAIRLGYGLSRTSQGGGIIRAISALPAVIGAWGKQGSGLLLSTSAHFPLNRAAVKRPELQALPDSQSARKWGRTSPRSINMNEIGKALLETKDPALRSLYVYNSNPAAVAPDSNQVIRGLEREDLFTVVHEQMLTDTARYADIVLPATTQMEHLDLLTAYGHLYLNLCMPAIPPLGEARPNIEVMNALAKAMGYTDDAFDQDAESIIRAALQSDHPYMEGVTFEYLQEHGFARLHTPTTPFVPFTVPGEFQTTTGRIELYSERADEDGYDPLPGYLPPAESAAADPEHARQFPINLLSPAAHHFLNSTFANISSLQKGEIEPRIWINHKDAESRKIAAGETVRVWNLRGEVLLKAVVSDNVRPGVAWSPSLWWLSDSPKQRNVNALTSARLTDMGGGSSFHTNLVQLASQQKEEEECDGC